MANDKAEFLRLFREARAEALKRLDVEFDRAYKDGDDEATAELRVKRRLLLDMPESIEGDDRESLIPQWPADLLPPLPLSFANPRAAQEVKRGPDMVVAAIADAEPVAPAVADDFAAIIAKRRERAPAEDAERLKPKPAPERKRTRLHKLFGDFFARPDKKE